MHAYSAALRALNGDGHQAAVPLFALAIELDPQFAMAYARLGNALENLGETELAVSNVKRAFDLRDRTSERENLYIQAHYYALVTSDIDTAIQIYREWLQIYPRDDTALGNISVHYGQLGRHEEAVAYARKGLEAVPNESAAYVDLAQALLALGRIAEADAVLQQMQARKLYLEEGPLLQYDMAFLKGDGLRMRELVEVALRGDGDAAGLLHAQSNTEAYYGRLQSARQLNHKAVQAATQQKAKETAAIWEADAGLWEAEYGNPLDARRDASAALDKAGDRYVQAVAAMALARAGAAAEAQKLAADLNRQFPSDTLLNGYWLPSIRAAIELAHGHPAKALEALEPAAQ